MEEEQGDVEFIIRMAEKGINADITRNDEQKKAAVRWLWGFMARGGKERIEENARALEKLIKERESSN